MEPTQLETNKCFNPDSCVLVVFWQVSRDIFWEMISHEVRAIFMAYRWRQVCHRCLRRKPGYDLAVCQA